MKNKKIEIVVDGKIYYIYKEEWLKMQTFQKNAKEDNSKRLGLLQQMQESEVLKYNNITHKELKNIIKKLYV